MILEVIEENFFSNSELNYVKDTIFLLENLWQTKNNIQFLPYGRYVIPHDQYLWNSKKYNSILEKHFFNQYNKIKERIAEFLGKDIDYDQSKSLPGFHIFGPGPLKYENINFHQDKFLEPHNIVHSYIIPICLPADQTGLLYLKDNIKCRIDYKLGNLISWNGTLQHSIAPFKLKENEYRITWQMHSSTNPKDETVLFW